MAELRRRRDDDAGHGAEPVDDTPGSGPVAPRERSDGRSTAADRPGDELTPKVAGTSDPRDKLTRRVDEVTGPGYSGRPSADESTSAVGREPEPAKVPDGAAQTTSTKPRADREDRGRTEADLPTADSVDSTNEPSTPTSRPADAGAAQDDSLASFPAELQERMQHDDTLSRLPYLSSAPAEMDAASRRLDVPKGSASRAADNESGNSKPPEASERVPANLREKMLQDAAFTRLGWGTDDAAPSPSENAAEPDEQVDSDSDTISAVEATDHPDQPDSSAYITELVAEHDKTWNPAEAALPAGVLPESTRDLSPEVLDAMDHDVRRILEYQGAADYIAEHKDERPWLEPVADASQQAQRIFTAIDHGNGHAHIRHGPMGNDQLYANRAARLEDPAQTDPQKRALSIDGLNESKLHHCAEISARIHDVEAFVAAYAGAVRDRRVREVLGGAWSASTVPRPVSVPIADLLGPDGHEACSGYRLVGESVEAKRARKEWVKARAEGRDLRGLPEPRAERIATFEGGDIVVAFASNRSEQRYEITSMFPDPPEQR